LTPNEEEFIGIWQVIPEVASGWADAYRFFDNGKFIFHYSQMVCDNRTLDYSGTWELTDNQNLKLKIDKKTIIEGGKLVPAMGSCGSDFEIEGGQVKEISLKNIETQTLQISKISSDKKNRDLKMVMFDSKSFWKLEDDPKKY
jgi:hypothetical protein